MEIKESIIDYITTEGNDSVVHYVEHLIYELDDRHDRIHNLLLQCYVKQLSSIEQIHSDFYAKTRTSIQDFLENSVYYNADMALELMPQGKIHIVLDYLRIFSSF